MAEQYQTNIQTQNTIDSQIHDNIIESIKKSSELKDKLSSIYDKLSTLKINENTDIDILKSKFDEYKKLYQQFIESKNGIQLEDLPFVYSNEPDTFNEDEFKKNLLSGIIEIETIDDYEIKLVTLQNNIDLYIEQISQYKTIASAYNTKLDEEINFIYNGGNIAYVNSEQISEYDYVETITKNKLNTIVFPNTKINELVSFLNSFGEKLKNLKNDDQLANNESRISDLDLIFNSITIPKLELELNDMVIESYKKQLTELNQLLLSDSNINPELKYDLEMKKKYIQSKLQKLETQEGGDIKEFTKITPLIIDIIGKIDEVNVKVKEIKNLNQLSLNIKYRIVMYRLYLLIILQDEFDKKQTINFCYLNRGLVQYYLSIILQIYEKFDSTLTDVNAGIKYFNEYHYILILKFKNFLSSLLNDPNFLNEKLIDINNCKGESQLLFILFNKFKDLLDSYNELYQKKITIYARINDKAIHDTPLFTVNEEDSRILLVNKRNCPSLNQYNIERHRFTEVFDSKRFKDALTISKYMILASQISKGKGIVFLTYGYSGTGKTYTLFGNSKKAGLLQSTLLNINNIDRVLFRAYEIYGEGLSISDYWQGFDNYDIITYKLSTEDKLRIVGNNVVKEKIVSILSSNKLNREDRNEYLSNGQSDFIVLANDQTDMRNVFKNFSEFIEDLDEIRKKEKRIVATKNNPSSSRSIIVYEFFNIINETAIIPFVLIDLPGREEIRETFLDPYLMNSTSAIDPSKAAKIAAAMLNPLYLSLIDRNIFETYKKKDQEIPKKFNEKINSSFDLINNYIVKKDLDGLKNFLIKYLNSNEITDIDKNLLTNIMEGYFINENIVELIKIILVDILQKSNIENKSIFKQSAKLKIEKIKKNIIDTSSEYYITVDKQIIYNTKKLEEFTKKPSPLDEDYDSKKIFNYDQTILKPLLSRYQNKHIFETKNMEFKYSKTDEILNIEPVESYKIFYLFTNDDADKKCFNQYKLLSNTSNLLGAVDS